MFTLPRFHPEIIFGTSDPDPEPRLDRDLLKKAIDIEEAKGDKWLASMAEVTTTFNNKELIINLIYKAFDELPREECQHCGKNVKLTGKSGYISREDVKSFAEENF